MAILRGQPDLAFAHPSAGCGEGRAMTHLLQERSQSGSAASTVIQVSEQHRTSSLGLRKESQLVRWPEMREGSESAVPRAVVIEFPREVAPGGSVRDLSRVLTVAPIEPPGMSSALLPTTTWSDILVGTAPVRYADDWTASQFADSPALAISCVDPVSSVVITTLSDGLRVVATPIVGSRGTVRLPVWAVTTAITDAAIDVSHRGWMLPERLRIFARSAAWTVNLEYSITMPPPWHHELRVNRPEL